MVRKLVALSVDYCVVAAITLAQETADGVGPMADVLDRASLVDLLNSTDGLVGELVTEDGWVSQFSRFEASALTS